VAGIEIFEQKPYQVTAQQPLSPNLLALMSKGQQISAKQINIID
jgi:hypothetical protein